MDSTPNNGKLLFDVGGTFLKAVIADGAGEFLPGTEYSVPMPSDGPREAIEQALVTAVEQGMRSAAERELRIGGLGIAFPGPFDFEHGIPLMSHKFRSVYGISLLDLLRTRTDVGPTMPVLFMHDVNAAMLGEMRCGNARGFANAALISLGTGLGFACCLDGRVQYSPTGSPRITIYKTPFRDGILEDYASKRAFLRIYGEITGRGTEPSLTVADLGRMAGEGDPAARETFATVGRTLGEALRARILEERIECLLLGGQISRSYIHLEPGLRKGLHGAECLRRIAPAAHIGHAAFYGLLARIDDLQTEA